uniref:Polyprotein protein n=1 Tax=Solanum tuberosum TaxID=4113 RepID=M1DBV8_SOLTU
MNRLKASTMRIILEEKSPHKSLCYRGGVDILELEGPRSNFPIVSKFLPATVTGDVTTIDGDGEFDAPETNEEERGTHDEAMYEDLEELEGDIVQMVTEASMRDTSMIGSRGSQPIKESLHSHLVLE